MDFEKILEAEVFLRNNSPIDDFDGLSPSEMHNLMYFPYTKLKFKPNIENNTLDQIPIFRVAEEFLKIVEREKFIKLTPLGALPKKVLGEIYENKHFLEEAVEKGITKGHREMDVPNILISRLVLELSGLIKKIKGKLTLTKKALKLLEKGDRSQIFKVFFESYTQKFNWGFIDGYESENAGQMAWAFVLVLIHKYQKPLPEFYAKKFIKAFPRILNEFDNQYKSKEENFIRCFSWRYFSYFLTYFGFMVNDRLEKKSFLEDVVFQMALPITDVFEFES